MSGKRDIHIIDELFREKLLQHKVESPSGTWESISGKLNNRAKKRWIIPRVAASIVALATAFGAGYFIALHHNQPEIALETSMPAISYPENQVPSYNRERTTSEAEIPGPGKKEIIHEPAVNKKPRSNESLHETTSISSLLSEKETGKESVPVFSFRDSLITPLVRLESHVNLLSMADTGRINIHLKKLNQGEIVNTEQPDKKIKNIFSPEKWSIGIHGAPVYAYRAISTDPSLSVNPAFYNDIEKPLLSHSLGISFNFKAASRLSFRSGIYYSKMGQSINKLYSYSLRGSLDLFTNGSMQKQALLNSSMTNSTGEIESGVNNFLLVAPYTSHVENQQELLRNDASYWQTPYTLSSNTTYQEIDASLIQNFSYLEIPFQVKYKFINRKIDISLSAGGSGNFLVGNNLLLSYKGAKQEVGHTEGLREVNLSVITGIGIEIPVNNMINFAFEPTFKYFITPANESSLIKSRPYSFGMYTGLQFRM